MKSNVAPGSSVPESNAPSGGRGVGDLVVVDERDVSPTLTSSVAGAKVEPAILTSVVAAAFASVTAAAVFAAAGVEASVAVSP